LTPTLSIGFEVLIRISLLLVFAFSLMAAPVAANSVASQASCMSDMAASASTDAAANCCDCAAKDKAQPCQTDCTTPASTAVLPRGSAALADAVASSLPTGWTYDRFPQVLLLHTDPPPRLS